MFHTSLALTFATAGGAFLVWPQWMEMDGSRTAMQIQSAREQELTERLDALRGMHGRLRAWDHESRRVMLPDEAESYPSLVQSVATREGAQVLGVKITDRPSSRWRSQSLPTFDWPTDEPGAAGEIRPRSVRVLLSGSFDSVFRSVASLGEQQLLFVPDRWTLVPTTGTAAPISGGGPLSGTGPQRQVRAEVWATVFVVESPEEKPKAPVGGGPLAANMPLGLEVEGQR